MAGAEVLDALVVAQPQAMPAAPAPVVAPVEQQAVLPNQIMVVDDADDIWAPTIPTIPTIWTGWNQSYYYTGSGTASVTWNNSSVWTHWNQITNYASASVTNSGLIRTWKTWNVRAQETHEQRAARHQREAERQQCWAERERAAAEERVAAEAKAKKILEEHLSPAQRAELHEKGHFTVEVGRGETKRRYQIRRSYTHNVYLLDDKGNVTREFCTVLKDCPLEDQLLLQKLYLESNEPGFYEAANIWDWEKGARKSQETIKVGEKRTAINRIKEFVERESGLLLPTS